MVTSPMKAAIHSSDCRDALTRRGVTLAVAEGFGWDRGGMTPLRSSLTVQRRLKKIWPHKLTLKEPAAADAAIEDTAADVAIEDRLCIVIRIP